MGKLALIGAILLGFHGGHAQSGWLGWNTAKAAISQGGDVWLPHSHARARDCRRLSYQTIDCRLYETGYMPAVGLSDSYHAESSGFLTGIRATRTGPDRIVVWSPYWRPEVIAVVKR